MQVANDVPWITLHVEQAAANAYLSRLDKKLSESNAVKSPIEAQTNTWLQYFIPTVIALAIISGVVLGVFFSPAVAIQSAISVLVAACPCTLGFITPLAVKIGMAKALDNGVQFASAKTLQEADNIDTVVFDLNGTLTTGVPRGCGYRIDSEHLTENDFFSYLAAIESRVSHPIARAVADYANQTATVALLTVDEVDYSNHAGVKAQIGGEQYYVGNQQFLIDNGIALPAVPVSLRAGQQLIYLAKNKLIVGHVLIEDPVREDAAFVVSELMRSGKAVHLCTGADEATAARYAAELRIPSENVYARCKAFSDNAWDRAKTQYIQSLQSQFSKHSKKRRVAMVGDAGNDAPAIQMSDFGIAVKSASGDLITQDKAKAVIDNKSLLPVVTTFAIAKQTVRSIKQNLVLSLAYNMSTLLIAGGVLVAIGFALNPAIGVALMVLQTTLILLNQYRIKQQSLSHIIRFQAQNTQQVESLRQEKNTREVKTPQATDFTEPTGGLSTGQMMGQMMAQGLIPASATHVKPIGTEPNPAIDSSVVLSRGSPGYNLGETQLESGDPAIAIANLL